MTVGVVGGSATVNTDVLTALGDADSMHGMAAPARNKTSQLQIRVSAAEKAAIARLARAAGQDMSTFVLERVLPRPGAEFAALVAACREGKKGRFQLAELNRFLAALGGAELAAAIEAPLPEVKSAFLANYVAAMVEVACARRRIAVPEWVRAVPPLPEPVFGSQLESLRLHLLTHSPPPFRRRNLFVDATVGDQV